MLAPPRAVGLDAASLAATQAAGPRAARSWRRIGLVTCVRTCRQTQLCDKIMGRSARQSPEQKGSKMRLLISLTIIGAVGHVAVMPAVTADREPAAASEPVIVQTKVTNAGCDADEPASVPERRKSE